MRTRPLPVCAIVVAFLLLGGPAAARDELLAPQTADPACPHNDGSYENCANRKKKPQKRKKRKAKKTKPEDFSVALDAFGASADRNLIGATHELYQEEGTTQLMIQAAVGDVEEVKAILASGVDVNETNTNGYTALMFAAENGNLAMSRMLVRLGADISMENRYAHTALFVASIKQHERFAPAVLLERRTGYSYLGESDYSGVIDYLLSIDTPVYESLEWSEDAVYTARAFFNIAQSHERTRKYERARENYGIAMRAFIAASELYRGEYETGLSIDNFVKRSRVKLGIVSGLLLAAKVYQFHVEPFPLAYDQTFLEASRGLRVAVGSGTADRSGEDRRLRHARENHARAVGVGIILECYENETLDDRLAACVEWAKAEYGRIDEGIYGSVLEEYYREDSEEQPPG